MTMKYLQKHIYNVKYKLYKLSNIITTIPTTIITTIPTTILTTIPTKIPSTILETTIISTIPTTILETTIIIEKVDLCNKSEGLYLVNYGNYTDKNEIKCLKKENYSRIYFIIFLKNLKHVMKHVKHAKNQEIKHITCQPGYQLKPEGDPKNNYVPKCPFYAFTVYEQFKCIEDLPCPKEYKYLIVEKSKCIDDCKRDNTYKYLYNGKCYIECPNNLKNQN